jgi:putative Holliday junction resolvase
MANVEPKSVLALDFGSKRIGVALSSVIARLAHPLMTLANDDTLIDCLDMIVRDENIIQIVVGYPRNLDGQPTAQTKEIEAFVEILKKHYDLPIDFQDESLTSVKAEAELKDSKNIQKADVDSLAATYILTDWLAEHDNIGTFDEI